MRSHVVVFEGYDGSGKSSIVRTFQERFPMGALRVVGRKAEPVLRQLTAVLEDESALHGPATEMVLRIAVEMARNNIVASARADHGLVVLDRGPTSLAAWVDYYDLDIEPFKELLTGCLRQLAGALQIVCMADFETCWARVERREEKSRKEKQGKERNRTMYQQYMASVARSARESLATVYLDTANQSVEAAVDEVMHVLKVRGML